jgi:co-chaperonin GroES (HSP10)
MRSPHFFIVSPTKVSEGATIEDVSALNREAVVLKTPSAYEGPISDGDTIIVHHNTFRNFYDMQHRRAESMSFFRDNVYLVDPEQVFLYKSGGDWQTVGEYCFVAPLPAKKGKLVATEPLAGAIKYGNTSLEAYGVNEGDEIIYEPESDYPFWIDDELLYRMKTKDICGKL